MVLPGYSGNVVGIDGLYFGTKGGGVLGGIGNTLNIIVVVVFLIIIGFIACLYIKAENEKKSKEGYERGYCHYYGSPYDLYTGGYGDRWGYYGSNPLGNKEYAPQVGAGMCGAYRCPYTGCGQCYGCGNMSGSCFRESSEICGLNVPCMKAGKCGVERANY